MSVSEVKKDIQFAIDMAWKDPNKTAEQISRQKEIKAKGAVPTADELITQLADRCRKL